MFDTHTRENRQIICPKLKWLKYYGSIIRINHMMKTFTKMINFLNKLFFQRKISNIFLLLFFMYSRRKNYSSVPPTSSSCRSTPKHTKTKEFFSQKLYIIIIMQKSPWHIFLLRLWRYLIFSAVNFNIDDCYLKSSASLYN